MAKKQTIIKKPVGNGNISITIENNLKNINTVPAIVIPKKRRRRNKPHAEAVDLPPQPPLPPLKDVSYIKPGPSNNFTVWRDNLGDSYNTTIPQGQAQQMGLLRTLATSALDQPVPVPPRHNITASTGSTQTEPIVSTGSIQTRPTASTGSTQTEPTGSFKKLYRDLLVKNGTGSENTYDNLQHDPYNPNESMEDRYSDSSFHTKLQEPDTERQERLPSQAHASEPADKEEPDDEEEPADKSFAVDVFEELAEERPGISIEEAGKMLATEEGVTAEEVEDFQQGKQSIVTTARGQGKKHGKAGSEMKGPYAKMPDYIDSYHVGRGEFDANHSLVSDHLYKDEELYRNSFIKTKAKIDKKIEKAVQSSENVKTRRGRSRSRTRRPMAKSRIEDTEDTDAGVDFDRQARIENREKMKK